MAWTTPKTFVAAAILTAAEMNTYVSANDNALRGGGLAIASQAANDFIYASSTTQLARLAAASGKTPRYSGSAWAMVDTWPVGSVFIAVVSTNPATLLGYGTWSAFGTGRTLVGIDAGQTEFDVVEETGGAKTHTLSTGEMPAHTHTQDAHNHTQDAHAHTLPTGAAGSTAKLSNGFDYASTSTTSTSSVAATNQATTATNQNTGGGGAHNNLQPYIVVYMWKRTA